MVEVEAMSIKREYDFLVLGKKTCISFTEEIESLAKTFQVLNLFLMTFKQLSNAHEMLENVGLLSYGCY